MDDRRAAAERICAVLTEAGYRALFAGGCVRDLILGIPPKDFDIATSAPPQRIAGLFQRTIEVGAAFGVQRVILPEGVFEVATFRTDGPYLDGRHPSSVEFADEQSDARRRDFTINALFYDPPSQTIIDYVHGQDDIRDGIIQTVGDPRQRFREDHLRLLRAVRFAARLDYAIDETTRCAIREMAPSIADTSPERVRDELIKILTEGSAKRAFMLLHETGLLAPILPEIARMRGVEQPQAFHPEGDVFDHTLLALDLMERPTSTLAMAVLLHDVGKTMTRTVGDRIRFNNHDKVGAHVARTIGRRLRMPGDEVERVGWLVEHHMRLTCLPEMRESRRKRFVRHEGFGELLELCRLDALASHGDLRVVQWARDYAGRLTPEEMAPAPLLNGRDLIEMGYTPGPLFGDILRAVEDAQLEGGLRTATEARALVRKRWPHTQDSRSG